jgi:hypothetical protein
MGVSSASPLGRVLQRALDLNEVFCTGQGLGLTCVDMVLS